ncbi:hypothetical protein [Geothrix edaphica]|uniref:Uncharacterized protein n=1 Tax=Geothrix edaphica TaxID=2927976 RepID=A0ABQ5Q0Y0_9BACT|nr:hypothetical protein [Geothrix edaphica]GLH67961.1 hypothetical protein GETHED_23250 [Geothrix edaphica]
MRPPFRPSALLWGLLAVLGGWGLVLRLRAPGHRALPWITAAFLILVALRVIALIQDWRRGRIPGTRILLPALILVEGLGLALAGASPLVPGLRLGIALALEGLLLVLAVRAWRSVGGRPGKWPEQRIAAAFEAFVPPRAARLMALELVMLGGALRFLSGGFREPAPGGHSLHREAALGSFLPALPLLIPGDLLLIRVLFAGAPAWLRWGLHLSTVYAVLWLFGLYAGLKGRPHQVMGDEVALNLGPTKSIHLRREQILEAAPLPDFEDDWARHRHMKGLHKLITPGPAILELRLREPVPALSLVGPTAPRDRVAVSVDDPAAFLAALGAPCA